MSPFPAHRSVRLALGAAALSVTTLAGSWGAYSANAAVACRSDPIAILSNGVVLDFSATIDDTVADVEHIRYTLHAPRGARVVRELATDGLVGYKETFVFRNDSYFAPGSVGPAGIYTVDILVTTRTKNRSLTLNLTGGYASALGIHPRMVGLSTFRSLVRSGYNPGASSPPRGPRAPLVLPLTVTDGLRNWTHHAVWFATVTSPPGRSGRTLSASAEL